MSVFLPSQFDFKTQTKYKLQEKEVTKSHITSIVSFFWSLPWVFRLKVNQIVIQSSTQSSSRVRISTEQQYRKEKIRYRKRSTCLVIGIIVLTGKQFLDDILRTVHSACTQQCHKLSRMQNQSLKEKFTCCFHTSTLASSGIWGTACVNVCQFLEVTVQVRHSAFNVLWQSCEKGFSETIWLLDMHSLMPGLDCRNFGLMFPGVAPLNNQRISLSWDLCPKWCWAQIIM